VRRTSRLAEQFVREAPELLHVLDTDAAEQRRNQRLSQLNVVQIPFLRLLGFSLVAVLAYLHNLYILGDGTTVFWSPLTFALLAYCGVSWLCLALYYAPTARWDVSSGFMACDILLWTLVIYASGGERSWLFFLLIVRVADQADMGFRRVLGYAHLAVASYLGMLLYIWYGEQRPVFGPATWTIVLCIYATNLYLSLTARAIENLRASARAAMRVTRTCLVQLDAQAQQLQEHAEQLALARDNAEAANRAKSEFLANVSHELLTPMNGIVGMTDLTLATPLTAEQQNHLTTVQTSATALLGLIKDLLDFSSLESGGLRLVRAPFVIRTQLAATFEPFIQRAQAKGLSCTYIISPDVPSLLEGDVTRLQQVLAHLLDNAIKFTEQGGIVVTVTVDTQEAGDVTLHGVVQDTGMGIPADKQHLIFEAFTQADGSTTRVHGGTGLGLTLVTQLLRLMAGRLWVESVAGRGSTFHFTVRLHLPAQPETA